MVLEQIVPGLVVFYFSMPFEVVASKWAKGTITNVIILIVVCYFSTLNLWIPICDTFVRTLKIEVSSLYFCIS